MSKIIIYGAGLLIATTLVIFLFFLTFHNIFSGQAELGDENNTFTVNGFYGVLINLGIIGGIFCLISYIAHLFTKRTIFHKIYSYLGLCSGILFTIGVVLNAT